MVRLDLRLSHGAENAVLLSELGAVAKHVQLREELVAGHCLPVAIDLVVERAESVELVPIEPTGDEKRLAQTAHPVDHGDDGGVAAARECCVCCGQCIVGRHVAVLGSLDKACQLAPIHAVEIGLTGVAGYMFRLGSADDRGDSGLAELLGQTLVHKPIGNAEEHMVVWGRCTSDRRGAAVGSCVNGCCRADGTARFYAASSS